MIGLGSDKNTNMSYPANLGHPLYCQPSQGEQRTGVVQGDTKRPGMIQSDTKYLGVIQKPTQPSSETVYRSSNQPQPNVTLPAHGNSEGCNLAPEAPIQSIWMLNASHCSVAVAVQKFSTAIQTDFSIKHFILIGWPSKLNIFENLKNTNISFRTPKCLKTLKPETSVWGAMRNIWNWTWVQSKPEDVCGWIYDDVIDWPSCSYNALRNFKHCCKSNKQHNQHFMCHNYSLYEKQGENPWNLVRPPTWNSQFNTARTG